MMSASNDDFASSGCPKAAMNQLVENNLSPPRGPDCCVSTRNAVPMNIADHPCPGDAMVIFIGADCGFADVPDARFIRYMPESLMPPPMPFIPGISGISCPGAKAASNIAAGKRRNGARNCQLSHWGNAQRIARVMVGDLEFQKLVNRRQRPGVVRDNPHAPS